MCSTSMAAPPTRSPMLTAPAATAQVHPAEPVGREARAEGLGEPVAEAAARRGTGRGLPRPAGVPAAVQARQAAEVVVLPHLACTPTAAESTELVLTDSLDLLGRPPVAGQGRCPGSGAAWGPIAPLLLGARKDGQTRHTPHVGIPARAGCALTQAVRRRTV